LQLIFYTWIAVGGQNKAFRFFRLMFLVLLKNPPPFFFSCTLCWASLHTCGGRPPSLFFRFLPQTLFFFSPTKFFFFFFFKPHKHIFYPPPQRAGPQSFGPSFFFKFRPFAGGLQGRTFGIGRAGFQFKPSPCCSCPPQFSWEVHFLNFQRGSDLFPFFPPCGVCLPRFLVLGGFPPPT